MRIQAKRWIAVALRAALLACCWIAVHKAMLPAGGGFMNSEKLLYFTYQSNVWAMVMTAVYFVLGVIGLASGGVKVPRVLQVARYAVAVSVTITFLVFWTLLAPAFSTDELLALRNQLLHTAVPILFVADFLLFDRGKPMSKAGGLWAALLPLYYLVFSLSFGAANPEYLYDGGSHYAYFFLNLDKYGWFGTNAGMGVLWWVLILLCLTLVIGYVYRFIQRKTIKSD